MKPKTNFKGEIIMEDNKILKIAAAGFIGVVLVPIAVGATIKLVGAAAVGVNVLVEKMKFNKKIKEGLKDGSIVEVDGQYYEVNKNDVEEA